MLRSRDSHRPVLPLGAPGPAWRERLLAATNRPPLQPRLPLHWQGRVVGSVEPALLAHAGLAAVLGDGHLRMDDAGCAIGGADPGAALHQVALALREAGLMKAWRNEQLTVADAAGTPLCTVERGACRLLGIATSAVHLAAWSPDGGFWVQQRAWNKPTDPGLWDTLVGGMVPAGESLALALERETAEEAGLALPVVRDLRQGGCITTRRPAAEVAHGYVVEQLHWFTGTLPDGVVPDNQDGEVAQFACMTAQQVVQLLLADGFALDAALILLEVCPAA